MSFSKDFGRGFSGFFVAFRFVLGNGMGWMFLVPIVLWVLLAYGMFHGLEALSDWLGAWAAGYLEITIEPDEQGWWSAVKAWINGATNVIVSWILKIAIGYLLFVANKYIVLVLLSPLLAYASERAEEIITGKHFPFSFSQLMKDAMRGALIAMRNGIQELTITAGIWIVSLIVPIITPLSLILLFLISAYFYGFSMFDYVYERRRMRIGETARAVNSSMGAVLANGSLFSLLMKVPLVGLMLAPVMASVGAVIATTKKEATALTAR
ncbi:MAG: EI24 domain-containing protein [Flavobacteriales bacterium]|nr:EI24 domain-containing protein [Flavobacteriales bacterium]